jgi:hypothetical protein
MFEPLLFSAPLFKRSLCRYMSWWSIDGLFEFIQPRVSIPSLPLARPCFGGICVYIAVFDSDPLLSSSLVYSPSNRAVYKVGFPAFCTSRHIDCLRRSYVVSSRCFSPNSAADSIPQSKGEAMLGRNLEVSQSEKMPGVLTGYECVMG